MSVIQFTIPKAAAIAMGYDQGMKARGREAGLEDVRYGYDEGRRIRHGHVLITCSRPMAALLIEQLRSGSRETDDARMTAIAEIERELADDPPAIVVPHQTLGM